jgi:hypothetical protein
MNRPILAAAAAALLVAITVGAPQQAQARRGYAAGIIGGMSAGEILAGGYYPGHAGYPAQAYYPGPGYYPAPAYPPPGCVITQRRFMTDYGWRTRKIRVCY